jgi:uncharacterized delta-60 repeat protein
MRINKKLSRESTKFFSKRVGMQNLETGLENKSIRVLFCVAILFNGALSAECIKPIYPGENLWKLVARIGECIDDTLELTNSKLDSLACANPGCEVQISQADIPYVITQPGIYCLAESVQNTGINDFLVTVSASNVVLDLKDHVMDGGTQDGLAQGAQDGIVIYPGLKNIVIKNGTISNCAAHGINASSAIQPDNQLPIERLTIANIQVMDLSSYLPGLSNMDQPDLIGSTLDSLSAVAGFDPVLECCLGNQFPRVREAVGVYIDGANQVTITNCKSCGVQGDGIYLRYVQAAVVNTCDSSRNGGNGFVFDNCDVSSVSCCKAEQNGFNGFYEVSCNGDNGYSNCTAKQNGVHGFRIIGGGKIIDSCIANQNTLDGFFVVSPENSTVDGSLDITFGGDGIVLTTSTGQFLGRRVVAQKDGKIVAAAVQDSNVASDFTLVRYNNDGSLDTSFGGTGIVTMNFGGAEQVGGVILQDDGKILIGGASNNSSVLDALIARYTPSGSLDTSFGTGGSTRTIFGFNIGISGIAIQQDGKIVVGGDAGTDFIVMRYNTNGTLDGSFGTSGVATTDLGAIDDTRDIFLQRDGKIVAVGTTNAQAQVALVRYNTTGTLDTSFGGGTGIVITDISPGNSEDLLSVTEQKDGKILVCGNASTNIVDFIIARYNSDGSLDTSFNGTGSIILNLGGSDFAQKVLVQKDGRILIAGYGGSTSDVKIVRYHYNGTLDTSFGSAGTGIVTVNYGGTDRVFGGTLQADSKLVVVGRSNNDLALSRYNIFKRPSTIYNSVAQENGRHGFNIEQAAKITMFNNVASNNACNGYLGSENPASAIDTITKNIGDNNQCADYSNIDSVLLSPSAGAWKNIRLS